MSLVIGHIALVQRSKKQDFVLDVIEQLEKEGFDVIGLFAGEVRDKEFMNELEEKVNTKGLSKCVQFLGRRNDIPDLLKIIDVLMVPSSFEGFPLAGLEAAAAGVPVAACNAAGAEEFIRVSGNGVVFAEDDVTGAVDAVKKILAKPEKYGGVGMEFAEEMAFPRYTERIKDAFEVIFKTV